MKIGKSIYNKLEVYCADIPCDRAYTLWQYVSKHLHVYIDNELRNKIRRAIRNRIHGRLYDKLYENR